MRQKSNQWKLEKVRVFRCCDVGRGSSSRCKTREKGWTKGELRDGKNDFWHAGVRID